MNILNNLLSKFKHIDKKNKLKEYLIRNVSFKFPYDFNYTDQHTVPQGFVDFGRGLISRDGKVLADGAGTQHDQMEKIIGPGIRFYWGFTGRGNNADNPATLHVVGKNSGDDKDIRRDIAKIASAINNYKKNQLQFVKKVNFLD